MCKEVSFTGGEGRFSASSFWKSDLLPEIQRHDPTSSAPCVYNRLSRRKKQLREKHWHTINPSGKGESKMTAGWGLALIVIGLHLVGTAIPTTIKGEATGWLDSRPPGKKEECNSRAPAFAWCGGALFIVGLLLLCI